MEVGIFHRFAEFDGPGAISTSHERVQSHHLTSKLNSHGDLVELAARLVAVEIRHELACALKRLARDNEKRNAPKASAK
jgi:hypothetical protein